MNYFLVLVLLLVLFPLFTNSIRCYKCDATNECKIIKKNFILKNYDQSSDSVEIIDCEHYCWKSISLGK
jgi:hypothetical protein